MSFKNNNNISNETSESEDINEEFNRVFNSWDDFDLNPDILRGIYSYGFEKPSPIQSKAIYPIQMGKDIIAQAQSGTGKTAAFTVGALTRIDLTDNSNQILIMAPTHELAQQICTVITGLSSMMEGLRIKTIIGGSSIDEDALEIRNNPPHIIVGCPGRIYDMIRRRHINANKLKLVILDEADEMLSAGFKEQVYNIFQYFNKNVQIALFSATLPNNIFQITDKFMRNPIKICVKAESLTLEGIKQYYVAIEDDRQKYLTLKDIYQYISMSQCIIYSNSVKRVIDLYEAMKEDNFPVCCIHSNMDKIEREKSFKNFRSGSARVLISSNVTSRGIDIQQVSVVINFDLPRDIHNYLHRIGRSGRWGRKGTGINFITRRDIIKMKEIETYYSTQIEELPGDFNLI
uniref:RNA helicase n=1 Tax=viral metagenome TaxID=1070528 RepID=A0A6C0KR35_9ZZZZ